MQQTTSSQYINIYPSKLLLLFYTMIAITVEIALTQIHLPLLWHTAGFVLLCLYITYLIMRYSLLKHPLSVTGLSYQRDTDKWIVFLRNKKMLDVKISTKTRVTRHWILLELHSKNRDHTAILTIDSIPTKLWSALKAYLN
jgi:hypothetical protein